METSSPKMPADFKGLGCPGTGSRLERAAAFLEAGAPRLALATAWGVPLAPYKIIVPAEFEATDTQQVADVGNAEKLVQEYVIDWISFQVQTPTAETITNDPIGQFFFQYVSGLQAKLRVIGTPRYDVVPDFTPISEIAGPTPAWILTWTNGLKMDFLSTIALPEAPVVVTFTFHGRTTHWDKLLSDTMSMTEVLKALEDCGLNAYGCKYLQQFC